MLVTRRGARFLLFLLKNNNYNVSVAKDGEEALKIMDSEQIDLIVLDVMMPKIDGYEFTGTLRECNNNLPILMVSAKQMPATVRPLSAQMTHR